MKTIQIDFSNLKEMRYVMDKYHTLETMLVGETDDGERTHTSIYEDQIIHTTYQNNGWIRVNVLYRDGEIEEFFDGKWK